MRVLKWDVPVDDRPHVIGRGTVVHVACQDSPDVVQVWTEEHDETRRTSAQVFGTGQPITGTPAVHLGSTVTAGGALVWHVYEVSE